MVPHFTIGPAGDYPRVVQKILATARTTVNVVVLDRTELEHSIVFCGDVEMTRWTREAIRQGGAISPSQCVMEVDEHGIHVSQECDDDSRKQLAEFVGWILDSFAPCRVFDHESDRELTEEVARDHRILFR